MNKKVISAVLAGAMAISTMGIAASAAVTTASGVDAKQTYNVTAELNTSKINAKLPAKVTAFVNPYKAVISADTNAVADSFADGVASPVYAIENLDTNKGLNVSVTPSITKTSLTISEEPIVATVKEKTIFAWLNTTTLEASSAPLFRNSTYDSADKSQVVFKEEGTMTKNIMAIDKSAKGYFRIQGDVTEELEEGESWTAKDTATFSIIFDLAASAGEPKDVTLKTLTITGTEIAGFAADKKSYDVKESSVAAATDKIAVETAAKSATASDIVIVSLVNGKVIPASSGEKANAATTESTATAGEKVEITPVAAALKAGDVIEIVIMNGTYTATYTINVIAD